MSHHSISESRTGVLFNEDDVTRINGIISPLVKSGQSLYGENYTGILDVHFLAVIGVAFISSLIFVTLILGAVYSVEKIIRQKRLEKQFDNDEE